MSPDYAFLLGVAITGLPFLALGYWMDQSYRRALSSTCGLLADERRAHIETAATNYRTATKLEATERERNKALDDLEWARVTIAFIAAERDTFATALRGKQQLEVLAEVVDPDARFGQTNVIHIDRSIPSGWRA